ncbi:MAG: PaaI family thioesterase [Spirochaetales bacterium]|jgi:acyl-CoA thioesterase|nr:PaaI family thioesterase [Spirochaetales bacterium]
MDDALPKRVVEKDKFAQYTGIQLVKAEPGYALARLEVVQEKHLNGVGFVQGGAIFTLADFAFAAASNEAGNPTLGINATISYIKGPRGKVLTAEAKEVSATNRLCTYEINVCDENGEIAAKMMATGYIKR